MRVELTGVCLCLLLAGCAPIEPSQPTENHPACPEAEAGWQAHLSDVLEVDESNLPETPPEMRRGRMHGGHEAGAARGADDLDFRPEPGDLALYVCSMHPQVRQGEPGRCPICGMELIPAETKNDE